MPSLSFSRTLGEDALELLVFDLLDERAEDSTSGMPARTSVASWRVITATSAPLTRREEREEIDLALGLGLGRRSPRWRA